MGKKSKKEKEPNKVKIKVSKEDIFKANEKLRVLFNEKFNSNIPTKTSDRTTNEKESTVEKMTDELCEIIKFYKSLKKTDEQLCENEPIDPEEIALNNLCEEGIKKTMNYGYERGARGDDYYKMMVIGIYGFIPEESDTSDPLKEFLKKASELEGNEKGEDNVNENGNINVNVNENVNENETENENENVNVNVNENMNENEKVTNNKNISNVNTNNNDDGLLE